MTNEHVPPVAAVLQAVLAALGPAAPKPGTVRHQYLKVEIAVLLESGKDDSPRFLSDRVREALMQGIASDRSQADSFMDIIQNGFHGYALASDAHLLSAAADLSLWDIVPEHPQFPSEESETLKVLEELSSPAAAEVIVQGAFDPENPDLMLLGGLNAELSRRRMTNPFREVVDQAVQDLAGPPERHHA
jgi:hypothetical protein